ncbi:alpha/beta-hydrolase [Panus rudis PR-1116 ss-1]|nr:alpha/beta-hydrolase [Panus rudis PR-1116 ss-1]
MANNGCQVTTHLDEMPYARQPWKALYVFQRLLTTLLLVPYWAVKYTILPRSYRPRPSWSIKQIIAVNFTRRVYRVAEVAGVTWSTRDPDQPCDNKSLKETRFEWVDPLPEDLRTGIVLDDQVPFRRVGTFVWPKEKRLPTTSPSTKSTADTGGILSKPSSTVDGGSNDASSTLALDELEASIGHTPVIGIFMHGGGYCHMSAHESSSTSKIPRRLMKDRAFDEIHAVEYRLLQHAPFPAAVQDAAAVYAHLVRKYQKPGPATSHHSAESSNTNSPGSSSASHEDQNNTVEHSTQNLLSASWTPLTSKHAKAKAEVHERVVEASSMKNCKIILIGDSAGGNLVLALARWIRDEGVLPPPDGLLLLSPSCDPSHAFPDAPSSYVPRPHGSTDYLVDTPEPRALLQRTFLGHNPLETMHSPYVSPASQKVLRAFYGDQFAASVEDLTIGKLGKDMRRNLRTMVSVPNTPSMGFTTPNLVVPPTQTEANSLSNSPNLNFDLSTRPSPTSLAHPLLSSPRGLSLFTDFPRSCVVLGDAERLEREVTKLVGAMERDGVKVRTVWVQDGVHDVLMMGWWDEKVRDKVWREVEAWVDDVACGRDEVESDIDEGGSRM